jgi:hypothetical protein
LKPIVALTLGVLVTAAAASASPAASGPDLQFAGLVGPPDVSVAGTSFSTSVSLRNAGSAAAGRSKVGFFLSKDTRRDASDLALAKLATPGVRAGSTTSPRGIRLTVPATAPDGVEFFLLYCADVDRQVRETGARAERNCVAGEYTTTVRHLK